jgi:hypothetical protein
MDKCLDSNENYNDYAAQKDFLGTLLAGAVPRVSVHGVLLFAARSR